MAQSLKLPGVIIRKEATLYSQGEILKRRCNKHVRESLELTRKMIILADKADLDSEDDGCRVLYGMIRDCAYKIRARAESEREAHKKKGAWDDPAGNAR